MKDYYYILGLKSDASLDEIKKAYRKLSVKFHPDHNEGDKFFEERFKEINEAYKILGNEYKRKIYDVEFSHKTYSGFENTYRTQNQEEEFETKNESKSQSKSTSSTSKSNRAFISFIFFGVASLFVIWLVIIQFNNKSIIRNIVVLDSFPKHSNSNTNVLVDSTNTLVLGNVDKNTSSSSSKTDKTSTSTPNQKDDNNIQPLGSPTDFNFKDKNTLGNKVKNCNLNKDGTIRDFKDIGKGNTMPGFEYGCQSQALSELKKMLHYNLINDGVYGDDLLHTLMNITAITPEQESQAISDHKLLINQKIIDDVKILNPSFRDFHFN